MRNRKPWVFARRRLFGWYVRLLTAGLQGVWVSVTTGSSELQAAIVCAAPVRADTAAAPVRASGFHGAMSAAALSCPDTTVGLSIETLRGGPSPVNLEITDDTPLPAGDHRLWKTPVHSMRIIHRDT